MWLIDALRSARQARNGDAAATVEAGARAQVGWDDCPPADRFSLPTDGFRRPQTPDAPRWPPVQRHYLAMLVDYLTQKGASSTVELTGSLRWFDLTLTANEVEWLVDTARRHGLIAPLGIERDARGIPVDDEWVPTEAGSKLRRPRGARIADLRTNLGEGVGLIGSATEFMKPLTPVLVLFGSLAGVAALKQRLGADLLPPLVAATALALIGVVLLLGMHGERSLRAAAVCWPRLEAYRPAVYEWITCRWRSWAFGIGLWVCVALPAAAAVTGMEGAARWVWVSLLALTAYAASVLVGLFVRWRAPLHRAYREEKLQVRAWRASIGRA